MLFLIAISMFAAATVGSVVVYQRGAARRLGPASEGPRALAGRSRAVEREAAKDTRGDVTPQTLRAGDIVIDAGSGTDFLVVGCVRYSEEKRAWALFCLEGGKDGQRFLEVGFPSSTARVEDEVVFMTPAPDAPTFGHLGEGLTFDGQAHRLHARGDARTRIEGETFGRSAGLLRYARYHGASDAVLWIEDEGKERRAYRGVAVPVTSLTFYPGELAQPDASHDA